jgi:hypothetical protein
MAAKYRRGRGGSKMAVSIRTAVLATLSLGLLAWAPGASAATLGGIGTTQYNDGADASRNAVLVTRVGDDLEYHGTPTLTVSPPCTAAGTTGGRCVGRACTPS